MTQDNTSAQMAFVVSIERIKAKLAALQGFASDHMGTSPDDINWGHVGTANAIEEALIECLELAEIDSETLA
jgi:hypothetical protein